MMGAMRTKNPGFVTRRPGTVGWTMVARVRVFREGRMQTVRISQKVPEAFDHSKGTAQAWARDRVRELRDEESRAATLEFLEGQKRRRTCASGAEVIARYLEGAKGTSFEKSARNNVGCLRMVWRDGMGAGEDVSGLEGRSVEVLCAKGVVERFLAVRQGRERADFDTRRQGNVSINSVLRQARSVLGRESVERRLAGLRLGDVEGFMKTPYLPVPSRFWTAIEPGVLGRMDGAAREHECAELRLAYAMARRLGLRLREILFARGSWLMRYACESGWGLQVCDREEEGFAQKGVRPRVLPLPVDLWEVLKGRREERWFVMPAGTKTDRVNFLRYDLSRFVRGFLPAAGPNCRTKTTHELRKQFGSEVMTRQGLEAAQLALGHMSRSTTEEWYAAYVGKLEVVGTTGTGVPATGVAAEAAGAA